MATKVKAKNRAGPKVQSTILWWLIWIALTIGSFFLAVWFWTPFIAERFGSVRSPGVSLIWVVAVFGTWLAALTPLMIFMYSKVDKAYEDARIKRDLRREKFESQVRIRSQTIPPNQRMLSTNLQERLKQVPETIKGGHLIRAKLKDGRSIENVFVGHRKEVLGVYDQTELTFQPTEIVDFDPVDITHPPDFTKKPWLRLDKETD